MRNHIRSFFVYVGMGMLLLTGFDSYAQTNTLKKHNWYFGGTNRAIKFNRVTNEAALVTNKAIPFGNGGSAVATDRGNGNVLFYVDGTRIYDGRNLLMPNGNGLNANSSANQPVAICPVPDQPNKYYVFTNTADFTTGGSISYTVVDMDLFGTGSFPSPAFGDVESKNNPIPTLVNVAEGMITLPHTNGNDYWLITQNVNSMDFNATLINAATYTSGVFSTIGSVGATNVPTTIAHMAYHEGLRKIAAAPQDPSTDAVILNFNEGTGAIAFDRVILNSGFLTTTNQAIYDIEWSASGQYLYISRHGEALVPANVLQYDYSAPAITLASVLPAPIFRSYGLQRGPDNHIYHLYQRTSSSDPFLIGRIDFPDSVASRAAYTATPGPLASLDFAGKQFPGFLPKDTVDLGLNFTFAGTCQNAPTVFFPFVRPGADSLHWDFADGNFGAGWSPIHTYEQPGAYNVTLRAFYEGQVDSVQRNVTINPFSMQLQLVEDTTACRQEFPPPRGSSTPEQFSVKVTVQGGTPASIVWSNGDMGETLTPDSAGHYYVVVTDAGGCSAYATVNVREYGLQSQTFNKWYFGDKAGIDFNQQPPVALNESAMNAPEGCSIICDDNGQTIFYTDGNTVYDRTHAVIASNIGGNTLATQSALIVPVPGDETLYYIFTTQDMNGTDSLQLKYSLFDLKQNAGKGAVVMANVMLFMKSTERITASGSRLIVHEAGNSTFRTYPITPEGIGNQIYTQVGTDHSLAVKANIEGYMKLGLRNIVAVPVSTPGTSNRIELFHLNDSTGTLNNYRNIDLNEPNGSIYGIEFAAADQGVKLFASVRYGGTSAIYEYYVDSLMHFTFLQRIPVAADIGAIQEGPDGQIYVATNTATQLGTIAPNADRALLSSFNLSGFALLGGTTSRLGLPNFIQVNTNPLGGPGITVTGLCAGDSTTFTGSPRDQIDEYNWRVFRNGSFLLQSDSASFTTLLPGPGDYSVTLQLHNRCAPDTTMSQTFRITPPPVNPGRGVPICNTPTVQLDANPSNVPDMTYQWDTGETTEILTISEQGVYNVTVTDSLGCSTEGQFLAADSRPIFDLGPDITICEDNNTPALNVNNPGMTYAWTIDGVPASTSAVQAVDVSTPGVDRYEVTVSDPVTGCVRTEDKVYTINVSPSFTLNGTNPTTCGAADGSVTLQIVDTNPDGGPYTWFISGPGGSDDGLDAAVNDSFTLPNLTAGTYSGIVRDQVSECTISQVFGLSDATFTLTAGTIGPNCDPVTLQITASGLAPASFPLQWTTTNGGTLDVTTGTVATGSTPAHTWNTTPLDGGGNYSVEVEDAAGCIQTTPLTITPDPVPDIILTPNLCNNTLTASGANAPTYVWSATPASGLVGNPNGTAVANMTPNAGTVTYTVTGTTGVCPGTESITIDVSTIPTPALAQSTECADTAQITATPVGTFSYRWFTNGTYNNTLGGTTIPITMAENGIRYRVQIFEPVSGCTLDSPELTASVVGIVDASLASTPPCDDGQPFTLTATTQATGATFAWSRDGTAIAGVNTAITQQTTEGRYQVDISKASCRASSSLLVTRAPLPEGELPNVAIICDDPENQDPSTATFDLDPGIFVEYAWAKNGVTLPDDDRVLTVDSKGEYEVTITDARGCTNKDETEVLNECLPKINAPNAFKPGSKVFNPDRKDLTNGDFWIFTRFIEDDQFHVFIFNRWGEMVFSSADRFFKWNGGYNNDVGRPLPPGTYSYVVQYVSAFRPDKGVQEKRGGVALIR